MLSDKELSLKLKKNLPQTSFLDTLKISYRPYICPFNEIIELVQPNSKLFDVGCGSGMFLMLLAEYCSAAKLGGIEISEKLVTNAKHLLAGYKIPSVIEKYDGNSLPSIISEFDELFMIDVYHHIPKQQRQIFMMELFKLMKPGAVFYFKDIDASHKLLTLMNKFHDLALSGEVGNEISMHEAESMLQNAGFEIQQKKYLRKFWYPHYLFVCKKL